MELAIRPTREPTDLINGLCVPEMFCRRFLLMGSQAPLHPAPWEDWMTNPDALWGARGACMFPETGQPCDCGCGCGWGNLGCGWMCDAYRSPSADPCPPIGERNFPLPPWYAVGWHVASYDQHSSEVLGNLMVELPRHGLEMGGCSRLYTPAEFECYPFDKEREEFMDTVSSLPEVQFGWS